MNPIGEFTTLLLTMPGNPPLNNLTLSYLMNHGFCSVAYDVKAELLYVVTYT